MIITRAETTSDYATIQRINDQAFGGTLEGKIVGKIRNVEANILSLVAERDGKIAGHIFFSPVAIEGQGETIKGMGLAPMAVLPEYQKQGIGSALIKAGVEILKNQSVPFIVVLGHSDYYPKFGFEKASKFGIQCQWSDVPDESFMILILNKEKMENVRGLARYMEAWSDAV